MRENGRLDVSTLFHEAANTRSTVAQSSSGIPVSMVAHPEADLP
jgi:hypothetical protein